jgi:hypothetical protein
MTSTTTSAVLYEVGIGSGVQEVLSSTSGLSLNASLWIPDLTTDEEQATLALAFTFAAPAQTIPSGALLYQYFTYEHEDSGLNFSLGCTAAADGTDSIVQNYAGDSSDPLLASSDRVTGFGVYDQNEADWITEYAWSPFETRRRALKKSAVQDARKQNRKLSPKLDTKRRLQSLCDYTIDSTKTYSAHSPYDEDGYTSTTDFTTGILTWTYPDGFYAETNTSSETSFFDDAGTTVDELVFIYGLPGAGPSGEVSTDGSTYVTATYEDGSETTLSLTTG